MRIAFIPTLLTVVLLGFTSLAHAAPSTPGAASAVVVGKAPAVPSTSPLNLNTADAQAIHRELSGVGEAKAQAIVAYREANGPFASVDELLEVKGIGKSLLDRNRDKLTVK